MGKVLIIDDEKQILSLLSRIIGLEGYEVFQATNCKVGIKQLEQNDPEVVLCDVCLPDGSGVELVSELKRLRPLSEVILSYMNFEFAAQGQGLFETLRFSKHASKTDISIFASDTGANIGIALEYYADLFSEADVLRMARDYVRMLELMTSAPADAPLRFTPTDLPCAAGGAASSACQPSSV